jgi:hypothetical protein
MQLPIGTPSLVTEILHNILVKFQKLDDNSRDTTFRNRFSPSLLVARPDANWQGKVKVFKENLASVSFGPPQIPYGLPED